MFCSDKWYNCYLDTILSPCWSCLWETNIIWKTDCQTLSKSLQGWWVKYCQLYPHCHCYDVTHSWRLILHPNLSTKPPLWSVEIPLQYNMSHTHGDTDTHTHTDLDAHPTWVRLKGQSGKDGILKRCAEIIQTVNFSPCPGNKPSNPLSSASSD